MRFSYTCGGMELRHLRYFVTVAEELNISRASARLRISQPAVSRQVRDLEEELGVELFRREKSGLKLTPAGETFLAHARDLLRRSGDAVKQMESFGKRAKEIVTVGYIAPVLASILTPALRRFSQQHSHTEVALREMPPGEQSKALREGRIDLALIGNRCPEVEREFAVTVLTHIPFQAVLPDNHLLALRKRIALSELEQETFIGFAEEKFPGRNTAICAACQAAGFTPRIRHHVENLTALLALAAAGKGVTLAPAEVGQLAHPQAVFIAKGTVSVTNLDARNKVVACPSANLKNAALAAIPGREAYGGYGHNYVYLGYFEEPERVKISTVTKATDTCMNGDGLDTASGLFWWNYGYLYPPSMAPWGTTDGVGRTSATAKVATIPGSMATFP